MAGSLGFCFSTLARAADSAAARNETAGLQRCARSFDAAAAASSSSAAFAHLLVPQTSAGWIDRRLRAGPSFLSFAERIAAMQSLRANQIWELQNDWD